MHSVDSLEARSQQLATAARKGIFLIDELFALFDSSALLTAEVQDKCVLYAALRSVRRGLVKLHALSDTVLAETASIRERV